METIDSKLTPEQLLEILQKNSNTAFPHGGQRVTGNFHGRRFSLYIPARGPNSNPKDSFYGEVLKNDDGSRIVGEFRVSHVVRYIVPIFNIACGLFSAFMFYMAWVHHAGYPIMGVTFVIPILVYFSNRRLLKGSVDSYPYILEFLERCARGETIPPDPRGRSTREVVEMVNDLIGNKDQP